MKTKFSLIRKMQLGFGSAVLILLIVGIASYRGILASRNRDQWVRHTYEVLENLKSLLSAMLNIETGSRGFVLTGEDTFLEPFRSGVERAGQAQKTL